MAHVLYLPFAEGTPTPSLQPAPPRDYEEVPTNLREFGGAVAQGEQQLGAGAQKAGQFYGQVAADNATNVYMTATRNLLYGDPSQVGPDGHPDRGYFGLEGRAAMDAAPAVVGKLEQLRQQMGAQMLTPQQSLDFDQYTRRFQFFMGEQISRHSEQQSERWYDVVEKNSIDINRTALNDAIAHGDTEGAKHAEADLVGSYTRRAGRVSGNDPTALQAANIDGQRDVANTRISSYLSRNDLMGAAAELKKSEGLLSPEQALRYRSALSEANVATAVDRATGTPTGIAAPSGAGIAGSANYAKRTGTMGDPNAPNFESEHITTIQSPAGVSFRVNKMAAADFTGFLKDLEAAGYKINQQDSGGYNKRNIAGTDTLSEHAFGNAIDINAGDNPSLKGANLQTNLPPNIRDIAARHNLTWGGDWHDLKDAMHFEWAGPGQGVNNLANNNPGNIKVPGGGGYMAYPTREAGVQAISDWLVKAQDNRGLTTVHQLIDTPGLGFAPSTDPGNAGKNLPEEAAKIVGVGPDDKIDMHDPVLRGKMVNAILTQEGNAHFAPTAQLSAGEKALATGRPDYASSLANLQNDPSLNPIERKRAEEMLHSQFNFDYQLEERKTREAEKNLHETQTATEADLFGRAVAGEQFTPDQLAKLVRSRQLSITGYNAIATEMSGRREAKVVDSQPNTLRLWQRIGEGEDPLDDIFAGVTSRQLSGETADAMMKSLNARAKEKANQVEHTAFSTLRTIAGMDAQERPMVDLDRQGNQNQVALWAQAQTEWNSRVVAGKEDPLAVLADMAPRYGHPVENIGALPHPRMGAIQKLEDVPIVKQRTQDAVDAGQITQEQFRQEQDLLGRYWQYLDAQQKREAAAKAAQAGQKGGARAVGAVPSGNQ